VSLKEIDPRTMASRLIPGLFFCGEVMDLDADTGGYNLQAAFSTAMSPGKRPRPSCRILRKRLDFYARHGTKVISDNLPAERNDGSWLLPRDC